MAAVFKCRPLSLWGKKTPHSSASSGYGIKSDRTVSVSVDVFIINA